MLIVFLVSILYSCGSSSRVTDNAQSQRLEELVSEKHFEIRSDQAMPMATASLNSISDAGLFPPGSSAGQISLIGNPNYLKVTGDSVAIYLPYFGERQMGGGYNHDGPGIKLEGIPDEMEITKDEQKQRYIVQIEMKKATESFDIEVTLFPNMNSIISVNSSQRFPIRYSGTVQPIPSEDK
ncbi:DUF4251 domain-containing protein [Pricia sp. S334]|uniref:DUF4251 domain-containing protein n=1 Tax=Pricia mediterranea TaxID=3076079 RepID=A0ABU3LAE5_9FLAO|nr:DUF4251 domain-containing protein [Pricia sp. S334]MDT7830538.1 DUF4251 domain-containing protein [Pricia sp. S334]